MASSRRTLLRLSTPSESRINALRPFCFFISSSQASSTASCIAVPARPPAPGPPAPRSTPCRHAGSYPFAAAHDPHRRGPADEVGDSQWHRWRPCRSLREGGKILEQFHLAGEVDDEGEVAVFAKDLIEKAVAGAAFGRQQATLAFAHIYQQAEGQWQVGLSGEIANSLGAAIFDEGEVGFGEIAYDAPLFIADRGEDVYHADVGAVVDVGWLASQADAGKEGDRGSQPATPG